MEKKGPVLSSRRTSTTALKQEVQCSSANEKCSVGNLDMEVIHGTASLGSIFN
jgi:hypothetical protein